MRPNIARSQGVVQRHRITSDAGLVQAVTQLTDQLRDAVFVLR